MSKFTKIVTLGLVVVAVFFAAAVADAQTYSFTRDLTIGSTGADVTALQTWAIGQGYATVRAWQAAVGLPSTGYFGPLSRAKIAMGGTTLPPTPGVTCPTGLTPAQFSGMWVCLQGTTGGSTGGSTGTLNGGEASLEDFEGNDGDDDELSEGGTAQVAEFEFDVEDADVRISRVDLDFTTTATGSEEDEPWNTFDTITLSVNGEEVASEDVSDEDEWLDNDSPYQFRFSNLDAVVKEGERAVITVEIEAAGSIDSASTDIDWTIEVGDEGIRAIDGAGIDQYIGDASGEEVTFTVNEEGSNEELNISSSSDDPEATVFQVEDDQTSDWYTVFAFELDAEESDIDLEEVAIGLISSDVDVTTVVNDAMLVIDGEEFDDFDWEDLSSTASTTVFDIDKDFTIPEGETVTVELKLEFKSLIGANYIAGTTITASTSGVFITGEGADNVTADGAASGETHTLQVSGVNVTPVSKSANGSIVDGVDNDYATYTIVVDVKAFDNDIYISQTPTTAYTFQIENATTGTVLGTSTATTSTISSTADTEGSSYRVNEGDTERFTFTITLNPLAVNESSSFRAQLLTVVFGSSAGTPTGSTFTASPENDYETIGVLIND